MKPTTARAAAISAASFFMIAGCSGGRTIGTSQPPSISNSQAAAMANAARAVLEIQVPPMPTAPPQAAGRKTDAVPHNATRRTSYVSPFTRKVGIAVVNPADQTVVYSTSVTLAYPSCTQIYGVYTCATNLPVGTYTIQTSLYDLNSNLLSTNVYVQPANVTRIYANGSGTNNISIATQGVVSYVFTPLATGCEFAQQNTTSFFQFLDADNNPVNGPFANPVTISATALNGAGTSALYPVYYNSTYGYTRLYNDTVTVRDNYTFQNLALQSAGGGVEGAIKLGISGPSYLQVYSTGVNGGQAGPASMTVAATNYIAWSIYSGGLYATGLESNYNIAVPCGPAVQTDRGLVNPVEAGPLLIGGNTATSTDTLVVVDGQTVELLDVSSESTSDLYTSTYFTPPPPKALLRTMTSANLAAGDVPQALFVSPLYNGAVRVLSQNNGTGYLADMYVSANCCWSTSISTYEVGTSTSFSPSTALAAPQNGSVYFSNPSTPPVLYSINTSNGIPNAPMYFTGTSFQGGQVTALSAYHSPALYGVYNMFVRGTGAAGNGYLAAFDATQATPTLYAAPAPFVASNAGPRTMRYDAVSNALLVLEGNQLFSYNPDQSPSAFATYAAGAIPVYTFPAGAARFVGSVPAGSVGVYGGGKVTILQFNGSAWTYVMSYTSPFGNVPIALTYANSCGLNCG